MASTEVIANPAQQTPSPPKPRRFTFKRVMNFIATAFFGVWQIAFVIASVFGAIPYLLPEIWISYTHYDMPLYYFVLTLLLLALPAICLFIIIWLALGNKENRNALLLKFFYGFELPAIILLLLFMMNLRDYQAGMHWVTTSMFIALGTWCFMIFYQRVKNTSEPILFANQPLATVGSTIMLAVGLFVSLAALLFVIPLFMFGFRAALELLRELDAAVFQQIWIDITSIEIRDIISSILASPFILVMAATGVLAFSSIAFLMVFPFVLAYLYVGQFITRFRQSPTLGNAALAIVLLAIMIGVHFSINKQPQVDAFAQLDEPLTTPLDTPLNNPTISTQEQQTLVDNADTIRKGLLNAYLARYRYFSSTESASVLTDMYTEAFQAKDKPITLPQELLNFFLKPILYDGDNRTDPQRAATLYEQFFDAPIQKAELDEIWSTLNRNHQESRQNGAGLLDVSEKSVYLKHRSIDITFEQSLATVRTTQTMVNKVIGPREAVVHFSLPEHSVITGIWLSDKKTNLEQHKPLVAPRGAAQQVYNEQVSRRIDPALLEKVGPELYRLRVFPILSAKRLDGQILDGPAMYVTMEYQTLPNSDGSWPIPKLLEKRHLFWDENTIDTINGNVVTLGNTNSGDWLPYDDYPFAANEPPPSNITFTPSSNAVWAETRASLGTKQPITTAALNKATVVLIDGSYSMDTRSTAIENLLPLLGNAQLYFCQQTCKSTTAASLGEAVYFGNSKPIEQVESYLAQHDSDKPKQIIVLTDDGSYEAESDKQAVVASPIPIWVLHIDNTQPYAYSDAWLTTINQSGGGFSSSSVEAFLKTLTLHNDAKKLNISHIGADWVWFDSNQSDPVPLSNNPSPYHKLKAAIQITQQSKSGKALKLQDLDELHRQAIQSRIVTELSSMIVLVNAAQKSALEAASKSEDRFDRENEDGTQVVGVPGDSLSVAAVPEPREWALILIAMLLVSSSLYQKRKAKYSPHKASTYVQKAF